MKRELDDILEQSLSRIAAGKADIEDCLASNPSVSDQLEPLLLAAEELRSIPKPVLSPAARARLEERVLAAAAADPRLRPAGRRRLVGGMPRWRWAFSALTALVLVVVLLMTTLVTASADALPGAPLYGLKRATEDAWLWVAPERYEPELHLRLARRRLQEIEGLAAQGRFDASLLETMTAHVDNALGDVKKLSSSAALPVLDDMSLLIGDEQQTLDGLRKVLPAESQQVLDTTLKSAEQQAIELETLRQTLQPDQPVVSPEPSSTPTPTAVPQTSGQEDGVAKAPGFSEDGAPDLPPTVQPPNSPTPKPSAQPTATRYVPPTSESPSEASEVHKPDRNPKLTKTPKSAEASGQPAAPEPTDTPKPTKTPKPTRTPKPTDTPGLTETPGPTETSTPNPTETPELTEAPEPTETPEPTDTPERTDTPEQEDDDNRRAVTPPVPTRTPRPTKTPKPTRAAKDP
jgi:hypothetical protein